MRDSDDLPYVVIERHSGGFGAFIWGVLIGAGAALLLAPRSGAETQAELRQGVRRVRTAAEEKVDAARDTVDRTRTRIEDQLGSVREQISSVRDQIDATTDRARDKLESGRRVARETRADLERKVADIMGTYEPALDRAGRAEEMSASAADTDADVALSNAPDERAEERSDLM